jgi:hypothetical protein
MQFLVYLTVLMVSVSTVLLEVHWLTSPPPQPKGAVRTTAALVPIPKAEGPNAELSPVYPTAPKPDEKASDARQTATSADSTTAQPTPKPAAETTGVAARVEDGRGAPADVTNATSRNGAGAAAAPQPVQGEATVSNNRCDIQSCSNAYKSFRASDCTYQPFDGPRRFCAKPPVQRTARDQRDESESRRSTRDTESRDTDRRSRWRVYDDDDDPEFSDDDGRAVLIHREPRW